MKLYQFKKSYELFERAEKVIPNGIQGPRTPRFSAFGSVPAFYSKTLGSHVWDVDGNEYIEYLCGFGAVALGYNDPVVEKAAAAQAQKANSTSFPSPVMVELAERLVSLIPQADWVVYGKNGSDVTTWATQVAREATGRNIIIKAKHAYHGFHAWCQPSVGVPPEYQTYVLEVDYNDLRAMEQAVAENPGQVAGIMLCPIRHDTFKDLEVPPRSYFEGVRQLCDREGIVLMFDDVRCGFRMHLSGSAMVVGGDPDIVCFGKSLGNGHALSVAVGKEKLRPTANKVYFSGTHFQAAVPMAAAIACLKEMEARDAVEHMNSIHALLKKGMEQRGKSAGLQLAFSGTGGLFFMTFKPDPTFEKARFFCGEMAKRGVIWHPHHNMFLGAAHTEEDVQKTLDVAEVSLKLTKEKFGS